MQILYPNIATKNNKILIFILFLISDFPNKFKPSTTLQNQQSSIFPLPQTLSDNYNNKKVINSVNGFEPIHSRDLISNIYTDKIQNTPNFESGKFSSKPVVFE